MKEEVVEIYYKYDGLPKYFKGKESTFYKYLKDEVKNDIIVISREEFLKTIRSDGDFLTIENTNKETGEKCYTFNYGAHISKELNLKDAPKIKDKADLKKMKYK